MLRSQSLKRETHHDGHSLASVEHARAEHLVPDPVRVARVGADDEAGEVLLDELKEL